MICNRDICLTEMLRVSLHLSPFNKSVVKFPLDSDTFTRGWDCSTTVHELKNRDKRFKELNLSPLVKLYLPALD